MNRNAPQGRKRGYGAMRWTFLVIGLVCLFVCLLLLTLHTSQRGTFLGETTPLPATSQSIPKETETLVPATSPAPTRSAKKTRRPTPKPSPTALEYHSPRQDEIRRAINDELLAECSNGDWTNPTPASYTRQGLREPSDIYSCRLRAVGDTNVDLMQEGANQDAYGRLGQCPHSRVVTCPPQHCFVPSAIWDSVAKDAESAVQEDVNRYRAGLKEKGATADLRKRDQFVVHRVIADSLQQLSPPIVKGRALVLYMIQGHDADDRPTEWNNLLHFWKFGVTFKETALFDQVDYIFFRSSTHVKEITFCAESKNIRFLWVPPGPCDLCAHSAILTWMGYKAGHSTELPPVKEWPYKSVVMANSGVRGPIQRPEFPPEEDEGTTDQEAARGGFSSSFWLDVMSLGGQKYRPQQFQDDLDFTTVAGVTISLEYHMHLQSYFLVIPLSALSYYFETFTKEACVGEKFNCIMSGELKTAIPFLTREGHFTMLDIPPNPVKDERVFSIHAHAFNVTVANSTKAAMSQELTHKMRGLVNPTTLRSVDPCHGVFVKFGGKAIPYQKRKYIKVVEELSGFMDLTRSPPRNNTKLSALRSRAMRVTKNPVKFLFSLLEKEQCSLLK